MNDDLLAFGTRTASAVRGQLSRPRLLRLAALFTVGQIVVAWALDGVSRTTHLGVSLRWDLKVGAATAAALIAGAVAGLGIALLVRHSPPFGTIVQRVVPLADWASFRPLDYVLLAACAAVGEEILFRGAVQPWAGIILQAVLFGLFHWTCPAHLGIATAAGLSFGVLAMLSGSLWPPIAAHFSVDLATGLALGAALRRGWIDESGRIRVPDVGEAAPPSPAV